MRAKSSSSTAMGIAIMRAIESSKPESERICYDPYARSLVNPLKFALSSMIIKSGLYGLMFRGAAEFIIGRDRYLDDFLKEQLAAGATQVVILGAGFDTRSLRIEGIEKTRVFEVDHPNTQALKIERLKKVMDSFPAYLTFVAVDFDTQTLAERLLSNGYDRTARTVFLWQGVTMYLTDEGVDSTLAFIANNSAPGSSVIFDYFFKETMALPKFKWAKIIVASLGEHLKFGISQGHVTEFLERRGFRDVRDTPVSELMERYFKGTRANRVLDWGIAIASAFVK